MEMTTIKSFALLLLLAASWSLCQAKPYRRRTRNSGPGDVRFKIKGVDRGMLEISSGDERLIAHDWDPSEASDDRSSVWFAFCANGRVVDEIGHVGVGMQLCQADKPYRRAVMDRATGEVFVRLPHPTDVPLEVVIYDHQTLYIRPQGSDSQILVAELEGTAPHAPDNPTAIHNHVRVVQPHHLQGIESDQDKYARWEIKVKRTGW